MRSKGLVYRMTMLLGFGIIGVQCFGSALWSRYTNKTPEDFGQGSGTDAPHLAEIEALLKVKEKKRDWQAK